jgi:hypothetical protein
MRWFTILVGLLVFPVLLQAESQLILLEVTSLEEMKSGHLGDVPARVNIYSSKENERRQNASIPEAARVLQDARGQHNQVMVEIVFHHDFIRPEDLIGILEGMKGNGDLTLVHVGSAVSGTGKSELEAAKKDWNG